MTTNFDYKLMRFILVALFAVLLQIGDAVAQDTKARQKHFNTKKLIGANGFDPVSYYEGKPTKGEKEISHRYKGITYLFSSAEHLEAFKSRPEKYEPAYGGWCAYAMGESGDKVKIDPHTYKITEGKLYLFYNFNNTNTLDYWDRNEEKLQAKADDNWKKILR